MAHQQRQLRLILYGADRASVVTAAQPVALRSIHPKLHTATRSPDVQGMGKRRSARGGVTRSLETDVRKGQRENERETLRANMSETTLSRKLVYN